ncbi:trypco2 family protein [Streptomyces sp. enrichment culture]|uniref:trypco2 family protein n=1 Tax=Streptomyces sp. enrichment culture TaxID=1795815 RepID=UPI003F57BC62
MRSDANGFDLVRAVQAVRDDLVAAAQAGMNEQVVFEVGDIQMEFSVEFREDSTMKGGLKAWVVSVDAGSTATAAQTHKISFTLTPKKASDGNGWLIAHEEQGDTGGFGRHAPVNP